MPLDFSLIGNGPQFGNVLKAYDAGRTDRKEADIKNALAMYATDPDKGIGAIKRLDPVLGMTLEDKQAARMAEAQKKAAVAQYTTDPKAARTAAIQTADEDTIKLIDQLDERGRKQAAQIAEVTGKHAYIASQMPEPEMVAYVQARPELFGPEFVAKPTFQGLQALAQEALTTVQLVEQKAKEQEAQWRNEDRTADNRRAESEAEERARHNREMEGIGRGNMGANITRANRPPAARGGGGVAAPSLPPGFVLD